MKRVFLIVGLLLPTFAIAATGQWQCSASDKEENSYDAFGTSMKQAMSAAVTNCKDKSKLRDTCKSAQSFCQQNQDDGRCIVSDANGRTWNATGADACKTALNLCMEWQFLHGIESQCAVKTS